MKEESEGGKCGKKMRRGEVGAKENYGQSLEAQMRKLRWELGCALAFVLTRYSLATHIGFCLLLLLCECHWSEQPGIRDATDVTDQNNPKSQR